MKHVFIILGYGIPKNILKDSNYQIYLSTIINHIFRVAVSEQAQPVIICCGGPTDCIKPYRRTEAHEIVRYIKRFTAQKPLRSFAKKWIYREERTSFSTLENLLYAYNIIRNRNLVKQRATIFCEQTRTKRIKILTKRIFKKVRSANVVPIDFDTSPNRYLPPEFIKKKEKSELQYSIYALQNKKNLLKHHKLFQEKFEFLRKANPQDHAKALQQWWKLKLQQRAVNK